MKEKREHEKEVGYEISPNSSHGRKTVYAVLITLSTLSMLPVFYGVALGIGLLRNLGFDGQEPLLAIAPKILIVSMVFTIFGLIASHYAKNNFFIQLFKALLVLYLIVMASYAFLYVVAMMKFLGALIMFILMVFAVPLGFIVLFAIARRSRKRRMDPDYTAKDEPSPERLLGFSAIVLLSLLYFVPGIEIFAKGAM